MNWGGAMSDPRDAKSSQDSDKRGSVTSDLAARIARARNDGPAEEAADASRQEGMSGMARAYRLAAEFVAAILVGLGLGWGVDQLFGTTPWGMIILLLLGFAAGVLNVVRAAAEMNAVRQRGPMPPAVPDDDE
jgi:ATP synthase protein I